MLEAVFLLLMAVAVLLFVYLQPDYFPRLWDRMQGRIPPGPVNYPLVGALVDRSKPPWIVMDEWGKKYGGIYSLFLGTEFTVIFTDKHVIRSALNNPVFDGRPWNVALRRVIKDSIGFSEGPEWKERRRLAITSLKSIGLVPGRVDLEQQFLDITKEFVIDIQSFHGQPFFTRPLIERAVVSAMCSLIQQGAITVNNPKFPQLVSSLRDMFATSANVGLISIMPWLRFFPPFSTRINKMHSAIRFLKALTRENVARREKEPVSNTEKPIDFLDAYRRQLENVNDKHSITLNHEQMVTLSMELLLAGSEDIISAVVWLFLMMLHYPDVQKKCQQLIDAVVGRDRLPTLSDKPKLGYIEAVTIETLRFNHMVNYPLPRRTLEDTVFMDFKIPKDTVLVTNAYSIHSSAEIWGDPEVFRPERFLDEDGRFVANPNELSFSMGRRSCLGETASKMQIFCLLAGMLQNFDIVLPPDVELPPLDRVVHGIVIEPERFQVCARERRTST